MDSKELSFGNTDFVSEEETNAALKKLEFGEIDEILNKLVERSRGEKIPGKTSSSGVVFEKLKSGDIACQSRETGKIYVDPDQLAAAAKAHGISIESELLWTFCHELVHLFSSGSVKGKEKFQTAKFPFAFIERLTRFLRGQKNGLSELEILSGYQKKTKRQDRGFIIETNFYAFLDEGVNEKIAVEVMQEYLKSHRYAIPKEDWGKMMKINSDAKHRSQYYPRETAFVDQLIDYMTNETGLDRETIWQAIKRGKFGQENIHDPETARLLQECLPADIYGRIFASTVTVKI